MTPPNVECFNRGVILILAKLYEAFPNPVILDFGALSPGVSHDEQITYGNTLEFLKREGYADFRSFADSGTVYLGCVLTARALSMLNSTPKSLRSRGSIGDALLKIVKVAGPPVASAELPALLRLLGLG